MPRSRLTLQQGRAAWRQPLPFSALLLRLLCSAQRWVCRIRLGGGTVPTTKNSPSVPAAVSTRPTRMARRRHSARPPPSRPPLPRKHRLLCEIDQWPAIDAALRALLMDDSTVAGKPHPLLNLIVCALESRSRLPCWIFADRCRCTCHRRRGHDDCPAVARAGQFLPFLFA